MNNKKRNQLIGFITLILVALLVAPYVITNKSRQTDSSIPLLSSTNEIENELVQDIEELNIIDPPLSTDSQTPVINSVPEQVVSAPIEQTQTADNNPNTTKNYVIQLVALKNKRKIEELVALLRLNNYDAYTTPQVPQEGILTRLFVGPYLTKEQADMVIIDLEHLTKLKGFVTTK